MEDMKSSTLIGLFVLIIVVAGGWWLYAHYSTPTGDTTGTVATTTVKTESLTTPWGLSLTYPSSTYGLAVTKAQLPTTSYIPPCNESFAYCFYRVGEEYKGTNFESAGLRVAKRTDLTTERLCLNTPPEGFDASTEPSSTMTANAYSTSVFKDVGDAAAGHYAAGSLYRVYLRDTKVCTEFETRIGETQYANYPAGSIKEFTAAERTAVFAELAKLLTSVTIASSSTPVQFASL